MRESFVTVGEAACLYSENGPRRAIAAMFTPDELSCSPGYSPGHRYTSTVARIQDRLSILGIGTDLAEKAWTQAVDQWHYDAPPITLWDENDVPPVTAEQLQERMRAQIVNGAAPLLVDDDPLSRLPDLVQLRVLVELAANHTDPVTYTQREEYQHPPGPCPDVAADCRTTTLYNPAALSTTIVLTEGRMDADIIRRARDMFMPHLSEHLHFMDYATKPQGSVGALATLVKALAASRVTNPVIAIADNDTAAHAALDKIANLPANFRVLHYPELDLLSAYPTCHEADSDTHLANVNGSAGSIEMYLGQDALINDQGDLSPICWRGHDPSTQAHQGNLDARAKTSAQERYWDKTKQYLDGERNPDHDWSGVHAILNVLLHAFE